MDRLKSSDNRDAKFEAIKNLEDEQSDSEEEEGLFVVQAKGIFRPSKKQKLEIPSKNDNSVISSNDSEDWETDESNSDSGPEDDPVVEQASIPTESIAELAEGRDEKNDDVVVQAIRKASELEERKKPPDIYIKSMVVDFSFHPLEEVIAIASIEGEITLHRYTNKETMVMETLNHHKKSCRVLMFNDEGSLLFSASKDKTICAIDTTTMQVCHTLAKSHVAPVYSLLCMDANVLASGDDDGTVKVWDLRRTNNKPVFEFKEMDEFVSSMATDSRARLLLCTSGEGTLTAFNTRAKKMEVQSELYESEMNCLGMVRQDTKVVTGLGNGMMYIFDWGAFGYHSDSFGDHPDAVNCMLPITDNVIITGCEDGKLRAVHLFPHRYVGIVGHHDGFPVERLDISTCGHLVASSSHDEVVRFWNISYFEDEELQQDMIATKKSVRNKKKSLRKEKLEHQLPSSRMRNVSEFFCDLAE